MAYTGTQTEGTAVFIAALGTDVSDAAAVVTAISGADQVGCLLDMGTVSSSRPVTKKKCITDGEIASQLGGIEPAPFTMSNAFSALDTAGQKALRDAYALNQEKVFIIRLNDDPTGTVTNPTYITFGAKVQTQEIAPVKDDDVLFNMTMELLSNPVTIYAAVTTP